MPDKKLRDSLLVRHPSGLHARFSRRVAIEADKFDSEITLKNGEIKASADSIMEVMMLSARSGTVLEVTVTGPDRVEAYNALQKLFQSGFGDFFKPESDPG